MLLSCLFQFENNYKCLTEINPIMIWNNAVLFANNLKLTHFRSGLVYFRSGQVHFSRSLSDRASGLKKVT